MQRSARRSLVLGIVPLFSTLACYQGKIVGNVESSGGSNTVGGASSSAGGGGGTPNGGISNGGETSIACDDLVKFLDSDSSDPETGTGTCPAASAPCESTRPGYTALTTAQQQKADSLIEQMSPGNMIDQLYGIPAPPQPYEASVYRDIFRGQNVTLNDGTLLRGLQYRDGGHGVVLSAGQHDYRTAEATANNYSTVFPTAATRAASWDLELELRVGEAIGEETMATRNTMLLAPCMNLLRHPYWGRSQETYGEDVYQVGRMASALAAGIQQHVIACAKHYAMNNIEKNRTQRNLHVDEQTLRELFTRHFGMVVQEGGVGGVMAAYPAINDIRCTQNKHLLTDILKSSDNGGFGFKGFVISDLWAMPGDQNAPSNNLDATTLAKEALLAGLDDETPWALHYSALGDVLSTDEANGSSEISDAIKAAARRIVEQKVKYAIWDGTSNTFGLGKQSSHLVLESDPTDTSGSLQTNQSHLDLSEEADIKSEVLLKNGTGGTPVLPIDRTSIKKIAVIGIERVMELTNTEYPTTGKTLRLGRDVNVGDRGSSRVNADPATSVSAFDGLKNYVSSKGYSDMSVTPGATADMAQDAELAVVVVGLDAADEGEEYSLPTQGDRTSLDLPDNQAQLVSDVLAYGKPTVIIIQSGSIVNLPWLTDTAHTKQATIWAGYGGNRQGAAYAKLLFGEANFSGKMAVTWPKQEDLFQFHDEASFHTQDYWFGYRYYDHNGISGKLVFPFGWGTSYTTFQYSNLALPCGSITKQGVIKVTVDVENTGPYDGDEIVQLYVKGPQNPSGIKGARPVKELKGFQRVSLKAFGQSGSKARITLPLSIWELRHWEGDDKNGNWLVDSGEYTILVGANASDDALTLTGKLTVHD
jgi:beta-glucosidase